MTAPEMAAPEPEPGNVPRASVLHPGTSLPAATGQGAFDPMRLCIYTAIGILAWILTPPFVVVWMATLGLIGYAKAYRAGLVHVNCRLRDVRLVVAYLAVAWAVGAWFTVQSLVDLMG